MGAAVIGDRCSLGQNVVVMNGLQVGDYAKIQNNVSLYDGVTRESDAFCGPSMVFTNVVNPRSAVSRKHEYRPTLVRIGASISANGTIVCGATLGKYCFIGAGAVVTRDVPGYALMRRVGWVCECGVKLRKTNPTLTRPEFGRKYRPKRSPCGFSIAKLTTGPWALQTYGQTPLVSGGATLRAGDRCCSSAASARCETGRHAARGVSADSNIRRATDH